MQKKAQAGQAITFLIVAVVILVILSVGFYFVSSISGRFCQADVSKFVVTMKDIDKTVKAGSVKEVKINVPCGADKIYFFNLDETMDVALLEGLPLLQESVESKAQKNVFLVKQGEIVESLYLENLIVNDPYYLCLEPISESVHFFLEGVGLKTSIVPSCDQSECTKLPPDTASGRCRT